MDIKDFLFVNRSRKFCWFIQHLLVYKASNTRIYNTHNQYTYAASNVNCTWTDDRCMYGGIFQTFQLEKSDHNEKALTFQLKKLQLCPRCGSTSHGQQWTFGVWHLVALCNSCGNFVLRQSGRVSHFSAHEPGGDHSLWSAKNERVYDLGSAARISARKTAWGFTIISGPCLIAYLKFLYRHRSPVFPSSPCCWTKPKDMRQWTTLCWKGLLTKITCYWREDRAFSFCKACNSKSLAFAPLP